MLKRLQLLTFVLPFFMFNANATAASTVALVNKCLNLHSTLVSAFSKTSLETRNGVIEGADNASFHYHNFNIGFKGICSNAQFFVEENGLKNTEANQQFIYVWSTELSAENPALSIENIEHTLKQPKNIKRWLEEKL